MVKKTKLLGPVERARKEARKKELKKNKKQRFEVRSAAIESKSPEDIISELDKLDRLEFGPSSSGISFNDKRKKLKDTWARMLAYYKKEDADRYASLLEMEKEYEFRHKRAERELNGVKAAQKVRIEDVFLPPPPNAGSVEAVKDRPTVANEILHPPAPMPRPHPQPTTPSLPTQTGTTSNISRATVIESKPIMFVAKATKFVPASVRNKINQSRTK